MSHTEEWHAARATGIGGSEIAVVCGIGNQRWGSPFSLWCEKVGLVTAEDDDADDPRNERLRIGEFAESMLAEWFAWKYPGLHVIGRQTMLTHKEVPYFRCSVDGFVGESPVGSIDHAEAVIEFKTDATFGWPDGPPAYYVAQCRWACMVANVPRCYLVVGHAGWRIDCYVVERDATDEAFMADRAHEFWSMVTNGIPPAIDGSDATHDVLTRIHPKSVAGETAVLNRGLVDRVARLRAVRSHLAKKLQEAENQLIAFMGDAEIATDETGITIATYKTQKRAGFYVEPTEFRVLRPAKPKAIRK